MHVFSSIKSGQGMGLMHGFGAYEQLCVPLSGAQTIYIPYWPSPHEYYPMYGMCLLCLW